MRSEDTKVGQIVAVRERKDSEVYRAVVVEVGKPVIGSGGSITVDPQDGSEPRTVLAAHLLSPWDEYEFVLERQEDQADVIEAGRRAIDRRALQLEQISRAEGWSSREVRFVRGSSRISVSHAGWIRALRRMGVEVEDE